MATCPECEGKSPYLTDEDGDQDSACPHCGYDENPRAELAAVTAERDEARTRTAQVWYEKSVAEGRVAGLEAERDEAHARLEEAERRLALARERGDALAEWIDYDKPRPMVEEEEDLAAWRELWEQQP